MKQRKSTTGERILVATLFILVLITFSLAQHDSKRLDHLYTLLLNKRTNVVVGHKVEKVLSGPVHDE